ncbi:MAG: hypothetical protein CMP25_00350 [Rickettsiales bacterium]|nr:hypothetical protein [Rickettsiales bacterium]
MNEIIYVLNSQKYSDIYYCFCMASTAAALGNKVSIFFSSSNLSVFKKEKELYWDDIMIENSISPKIQNEENILSGQVSLEQLIESSEELKINFLYCSMLEKKYLVKKFYKNIKIKSSNLGQIFSQKKKESKIIFI